MATKKPRKMSEGVKRTLAAKRKTKKTPGAAKKVAEKVLKDSQTETVTVRISNVIDSEAVAKRGSHAVPLPSLHRIADDQRQARPRADGAHHADCGQCQPTRQFHGVPCLKRNMNVCAQGKGPLVMPEVKVENRPHSQWL